MPSGLLALQGVHVAILLLHDWVPLGRLSNLAAVRASDSTGQLLGVTLLGALPYALPFGVCCSPGVAARWRSSSWTQSRRTIRGPAHPDPGGTWSDSMRRRRDGEPMLAGREAHGARGGTGRRLGT